MPDRDWYDWHVPRYWRAAARGIARGDSPQRASDRAMKALTKMLKEGGGVPGVRELANVVQAHADGMDISRAFQLARQIGLDAGGSELVNLGVRAALASIVAREHGQAHAEAIPEISMHFVRCAMEQYLFDPAQPQHLGKRFTSVPEAREFERAILGRLPTWAENTFRTLLEDPSASRLRTPARTVRKEGTGALLDQELR